MPQHDWRPLLGQHLGKWVDLKALSLSPQTFVAAAAVIGRVMESPVSYPSELLPGSWFPRSRELLLMDVYSVKHLLQNALRIHTVIAP